MNNSDTEITISSDTEKLTAEIYHETSTTTEFFPVSEGKFLTLYFLSFGIYGAYWFYQNWNLQKKHMDKKIYPFWRAIFSIFFTHALFKRINNRAQQLNIKQTFNTSMLATLFITTIIASNILDPSALTSNMLDHISNNSVIITSLFLFFISAYPLAKVQATVNRINNDMLGFLNHKYSLWNYLLIVLGTISWIFLGFSLLAESMGMTTTV